jgi:SAM-dependent methyltransferase
MRYGVAATNPAERVFLAAGLLPKAALEGYAPAYARVLVLATEMGVFEALAGGPKSAPQIASECGADARATRKMLDFLVGMRYLSRRTDGYRLSADARRFLLADAPSSIRDMVLMKRLEWRWLEGLDEFVRTGKPLNVHAEMSPEDWRTYQRGMRAQANPAAPLIARFVPVPRGAREMLDVGGSHGHFSAAICRRHPGLRSTVLDLPQAVEHAAPILADEGMGDRVVLRAGDALTDDLGEAAYDLVFMFSLVHHFDDATNRALVARCARAVRPGGVLAIGDVMRPSKPGRGGQMAAFYDLYFALISEAGLPSFDEIRDWQAAAGLRPRRPTRLPFAAGVGIQAASKPRNG